MEKNASPWKKLSGEKVYENPWIQVEEHNVINPGGGKSIYGKVHFKNKAIGIIPLDENQFTWLVGQHRYVLGEYSWEIPMGGGALDKNLLGSAKRELLEETGLAAKKWELILKVHTSNSVTDEEGFVYLAEDLSQHKPDPDETESDLKVKKLPFKEALKMVMEGNITDSLSVSGILKVAFLKSIQI